MINLQQNIKRCKDTANQEKSLKRGTSFFSIMENIQQRSGRINSKVVTSLLKPHQLDLFEMRWAFSLLSNRLFSNLRRLNNSITFSSDGVLVTKVDMLTGASLPIPDTLLEIEGRDALAMALDTWKVLSEELRNKGGEMRVVLIRQIENVESSLIRYAIGLNQFYMLISREYSRIFVSYLYSKISSTTVLSIWLRCHTCTEPWSSFKKRLKQTVNEFWTL